MKINTQIKGVPTFAPIELTIRIESKRELELLWAIANGSWDHLVTYANTALIDSVTPFNIQEEAVRTFHEENGMASQLYELLKNS